MLRPLLAGWIIAGTLLAAAPAAALPTPGFISPAQEFFDMPRVIDMVATSDQRQLYGVGALGTAGHPAIALWQNNLDDGTLAIQRVWRADELDPQPVAVYFAIALSPDQRYLYVAGRTFSYQSRIQVFWRDPEGAIVLMETYVALPASTGDGDLLVSADGNVLYYGSRGITSLDRDPLSGKLSPGAISSTTSITQILQLAGGELAAVGELVLTRWALDAQGHASLLSSIPVQSYLGLDLTFSTRLAQSLDGSYLYVLAFEDQVAGVQDWALLVYHRADFSFIEVALGGHTGTEPYSMLIHPVSGNLYWHRAGNHQLVETRESLGGGQGFGLAGSNYVYPLAEDDPSYRYAAGLFLGPAHDLLLGSLVSRPLQRYRTGELGDGLEEADTFRGVSHLIEPVEIVATPDDTIWVPSLRADAINTFQASKGRLEHVATQTGLGIERLIFLGNTPGGVASLPREGGIRRFVRVGGELQLQGPLTAIAEPRFPVAEPGLRHLYVANPHSTAIVDLGNLAVVATSPLTATHPPRVSPDGRTLLFNRKDVQGAFPRFAADQARRDDATGALTQGPSHPGLLDAIDFAFAPDGRFVYTLHGGAAHLSAYTRDPGTGDLGTLVQELPIEDSQPGLFHFDGQLRLDGDGRFLYAWLALESTLYVFERSPFDGRFALVETLRSGMDDFATRGPAVELKVGGTSNELYLLDRDNNRLSMLKRNCREADARTLCLGGRFRVEAMWQTSGFQEGDAGTIDTPPSSSGLFSFFSPGNWEMLVKVLDGCAINGEFWVFGAAATEVAHQLRVTDSVTGERVVYQRPAGPEQPALIDTSALAVCDAGGAGGQQRMDRQPFLGPSSPAAGELELGAFRARLHWETAAGLEGQGQPVPLASDESGLFTFFSPENWELLVKVLDGCAINGNYWVFGAAATDVGYALEIEAPGGATKTYTNPVGQRARTISDTAAFPCSD